MLYKLEQNNHHLFVKMTLSSGCRYNYIVLNSSLDGYTSSNLDISYVMLLFLNSKSLAFSILKVLLVADSRILIRLDAKIPSSPGKNKPYN